MRGKRRPRLSRLGLFIRDNHVKPAQLADVSGVSRQYLLRLRYGRAEPTRQMMIWLAGGCRRILHRPVSVAELLTSASSGVSSAHAEESPASRTAAARRVDAFPAVREGPVPG